MAQRELGKAGPDLQRHLVQHGRPLARLALMLQPGLDPIIHAALAPVLMLLRARREGRVPRHMMDFCFCEGQATGARAGPVVCRRRRAATGRLGHHRRREVALP